MVLVALRSKIVHWSSVYPFTWISDTALFYSPLFKIKILLFFQTWSNDVNENQKWQIVFVLFPNCMPCQMERMLCVMLGTCRMVAFDYLDTHTYPIIPAVKKSPSDIFVVFCLRSKRLKNFILRIYWGLKMDNFMP